MRGLLVFIRASSLKPCDDQILRVFFQEGHVTFTWFGIFLSDSYHVFLVLVHPSSYVYLLIDRLNIGQFDTLELDLWHRVVKCVGFVVIWVFLSFPFLVGLMVNISLPVSRGWVQIPNGYSRKFSVIETDPSQSRCHFDFPTLTLLRDGSTLKWASLQPSVWDHVCDSKMKWKNEDG